MIQAIKKLKHLFEMRSNARRYGVDFKRRATFQIPSQIGKGRRLAFTQEHGAMNDFITIFIDDCYRILQTKDLTRVLDIGSNIGFFSVAAKSMYPNALVHAYEPFMDLAKYLDPNKQEFSFEVFYEAVGGGSGRVNIETNGDSNQTRVRESIDGSVPKISIDEAIDRMGGDIDLLKIDCEGSEWEMFEKGTNWEKVNRIAMEYHNFDRQPHRHIGVELNRLGFKMIDHRFDPNVTFGMAYAINPLKLKCWN